MIGMHGDYDFCSLELFEKACKKCTYCVKCTCDSTPSLACRNVEEMNQYRGIPWHELYVRIELVKHHKPLGPGMQEKCPRNVQIRECL